MQPLPLRMQVLQRGMRLLPPHCILFVIKCMKPGGHEAPASVSDAGALVCDAAAFIPDACACTADATACGTHAPASFGEAAASAAHAAASVANASDFLAEAAASASASRVSHRLIGESAAFWQVGTE